MHAIGMTWGWLGWVIGVVSLAGCQTADETTLNDKVADMALPTPLLDAYLGPAACEIQPLFTHGRFPCVTVATDGSVVATWGQSDLRSRRSVDGGVTWSDEVLLASSGIQGGGTLVDDGSGALFAFAEAAHPPADITVFRSDDHGASWTVAEVTIQPNSLGHLPSMHMNDSGLTLTVGEHAGRLIRPTRYYAGTNDKSKWPEHYTNAMFSDDGGATWTASEPFPGFGMGEATLAELSDGRIYYNTRVHWPEAERPTRRRHAWSDDGGVTWTDASIVDALPDGRQDRAYGCMGGLVRLHITGRDVLLFSNLDTPNPTRERVTIWASFDGGMTWPMKRLVFDGPSAYSSLTTGHPGTPSAGWAYLQFEGGPEGACSIARFNLSWVLEGSATGDGTVPDWLPPTDA